MDGSGRISKAELANVLFDCGYDENQQNPYTDGSDASEIQRLSTQLEKLKISIKYRTEDVFKLKMVTIALLIILFVNALMSDEILGITGKKPDIVHIKPTPIEIDKGDKKDDADGFFDKAIDAITGGRSSDADDEKDQTNEHESVINPTTAFREKTSKFNPYHMELHDICVYLKQTSAHVFNFNIMDHPLFSCLDKRSAFNTLEKSLNVIYFVHIDTADYYGRWRKTLVS